MLCVNSVVKKFGNKVVLKDTSFTMNQNKSLGIIGASGSGKSTLAKIIVGTYQQTSGEILWNGKSLRNMNYRDRIKNIQLIFQHPESSFDPRWKIGNTLNEVCRLFSIPNKRIFELLENLQLNQRLLSRYPFEISGGEVQRMSLLRALLFEPKLIIFDEATSMLDVSVQAEVWTQIKRIQSSLGFSQIYISHDIDLLTKLCDELIFIESGKIVYSCMSHQLFEQRLPTSIEELLNNYRLED